MSARSQTLIEEKVNVLTHGFGVLISLALIYFLFDKVIAAGDIIMLYGISIFAFGLLAVYVSSTVYHAIQHPGYKRKANVIDHISIFLLIGGTYAPIILRFVPTATALVFLTAQWLIILTGVILKLFYTGRYEKISVALYVSLGWMLVFVIKPLIATMPVNIFFWIIAGGFCYTGGIVFYLSNHRKHAHNIWHCFVLAGTILHFIAVYKSIDVNVVF